jgi:hypothetical protein
VEDQDIELIAEQLRRANALLRADLDALRAELEHQRAFIDHRLRSLEESSRDHEQRIRAASDGIVQFKVWSGLANGGSTLVAVVAFVRAFFGG